VRLAHDVDVDVPPLTEATEEFRLPAENVRAIALVHEGADLLHPGGDQAVDDLERVLGSIEEQEEDVDPHGMEAANLP